MGVTIEELVAQVPKQTEERVKYIKREYTNKIHNILRAETGFRLSTSTNDPNSQKKIVTVSVKIEPGVPGDIRGLKIPEEQELPLLLSPWRRKLEQFVNSGGVLGSELIPKLEENHEFLIRNRSGAFKTSIELAQELLEIARKSRLIEILFGQVKTYETDVLGSYRYYSNNNYSALPHDEKIKSEIILYWGVIGLVAEYLNVSVEAMALKVLAHEWGHAYSHVAFDIDGQQWRTSGFQKADIHVKEGIAQYCALKVIEDLEQRFPDVKDAYENLYLRQPSPYRAHLPWLQYKPEEIRQAILIARREGSIDIEDFNHSLQRARSLLRK